MGKNIKSYATIRCPFPREREGSLTAKVLKFFVLNMVRLNRTHYSLLKIFTGKIFNFSKLSHQVRFQRITQIPCSSPTQSANYAKFAHFVNPSYYVSGTCSGREPWKIPANYADSARFAHTARESRKFRTLRTIIKTYVIDFQISDHRQRTQENWSESTRFRSIRPLITRITRIPRISQ